MMLELLESFDKRFKRGDLEAQHTRYRGASSAVRLLIRVILPLVGSSLNREAAVASVTME